MSLLKMTFLKKITCALHFFLVRHSAHDIIPEGDISLNKTYCMRHHFFLFQPLFIRLTTIPSHSKKIHTIRLLKVCFSLTIDGAGVKFGLKLYNISNILNIKTSNMLLNKILISKFTYRVIMRKVNFWVVIEQLILGIFL